jgi:transcriptional repressor NrdR
MRCPRCGSTENRAANTRHSDDHTLIRRQRKCADCGKSWYTIEKNENPRETQYTNWIRSK